MRAFFILCVLATLTACATRPPAPESVAERPFSLEQDLLGETVARGEFRTLTGVERGFTAYLNGAREGDTFVLVEDFVFDDGERDRKTWRFTSTGPGRYRGEREDVVGDAIGFMDGNVFRLEYDVVLGGDGETGRRVRFRDVLALQPGGEVLNEATIGFWGLRVGSVRLVIERTPHPQAPE